MVCIGNSITFGAGIKGADSTYPAQLGKLLGNNWAVKNFGVSSSTLLQKGNMPYRNQLEWSAAMAYEPDAVVKKLGTNDSKPYNWKYAAEFKADYLSMIDLLR